MRERQHPVEDPVGQVPDAHGGGRGDIGHARLARNGRGHATITRRRPAAASRRSRLGNCRRALRTIRPPRRHPYIPAQPDSGEADETLSCRSPGRSSAWAPRCRRPRSSASPRTPSSTARASWRCRATTSGEIFAMANGRMPFDAKLAAENAEILATLTGCRGSASSRAPTRARPRPSRRSGTRRTGSTRRRASCQDDVAKLNVAAKTGNLDQIKTAVGASRARRASPATTTSGSGISALPATRRARVHPRSAVRLRRSQARRGASSRSSSRSS